AATGSSQLFGPGTRIGAARVQRLFGQRPSGGVVGAEGDDGQASNRVVSMDGRLQMTPEWSFSGQAMHTEDRDAASGREIGAAFAAAVSRSAPHFSYSG